MSKTPGLSHYSLATPATFRLRLLGHLDASWLDELGGGEIEYFCPDTIHTVTTLTIHFVDQAALIGLVNLTYGLGFPLVSVECLQVG